MKIKNMKKTLDEKIFVMSAALAAGTGLSGCASNGSEGDSNLLMYGLIGAGILGAVGVCKAIYNSEKEDNDRRRYSSNSLGGYSSLRGTSANLRRSRDSGDYPSSTILGGCGGGIDLGSSHSDAGSHGGSSDSVSSGGCGGHGCGGGCGGGGCGGCGGGCGGA